MKTAFGFLNVTLVPVYFLDMVLGTLMSMPYKKISDWGALIFVVSVVALVLSPFVFVRHVMGKSITRYLFKVLCGMVIGAGLIFLPNLSFRVYSNIKVTYDIFPFLIPIGYVAAQLTYFSYARSGYGVSP